MNLSDEDFGPVEIVEQEMRPEDPEFRGQPQLVLVDAMHARRQPALEFQRHLLLLDRLFPVLLENRDRRVQVGPLRAQGMLRVFLQEGGKYLIGFLEILLLKKEAAPTMQRQRPQRRDPPAGA